MTNRDYSKGKVYKIIANNAPEEEKIYVGSTTKDYLSQRMTAHRTLYLQWKNGKVKHMHAMAYVLFDKYGIENCSIILLEQIACKTKDELLAREKHYFLSLNCINKKSPINTIEEQAQKDREYYHLNKERYKLYREENKGKHQVNAQQYYEANKEKIKEVSRINEKKRAISNPDKVKQQRHDMYIKHKDKIIEYNQINLERIKENKTRYYDKVKHESISCACGTTCRKAGIRRHEKTKLHQDYLKTVNVLALASEQYHLTY